MRNFIQAQESRHPATTPAIGVFNFFCFFLFILSCNMNNFMDCLALALSCCALWEIWNFRNSVMADKTPSCINKKLIFWASHLAPLIKAKYTRSLTNSITLDILQVNEPEVPCTGEWNAWFPGTSGISLSMAFNDYKAAAVLRDEKGTFKFGVVVQIQQESLFDAVIAIMESPEIMEAQVSYVSSSHKEISLFQSDLFEGSWENFVAWRKAKEKLTTCLIKYVPPILNGPAIALSCSSFEKLPACFNATQQLPIIVQQHIIDDYLKLPKWCRKDGLKFAPYCHCYDLFKCSFCCQRGSGNHSMINAAGIICGD
ncbi:hypothetical protein QQ045_005986 [Rhodiola kirilowii]